MIYVISGGMVASFAGVVWMFVILAKMSRPAPMPSFASVVYPMRSVTAEPLPVIEEEPVKTSGYIGRHRAGFTALPVDYASGINYATYIPTYIGEVLSQAA